jgi:hypothetical protein
VRSRILATSLYFFIASVVLFYFGDRDYFCSPTRTGHSYIHTVAILALACTLWSLLAGASGAMANRIMGKEVGSTISGVLILLSAGAGFVSIPFWIYRGYGVFLFEHTWADVSCFFTEGYGMSFPFVVAPILTAATLFQEWVIFKSIRKTS